MNKPIQTGIPKPEQVDIICERCGETKKVCKSCPPHERKVCSDCKIIEYKTKRTNHLNTLKSLPLEERVTKIEEWKYDLSISMLGSGM